MRQFAPLAIGAMMLCGIGAMAAGGAGGATRRASSCLDCHEKERRAEEGAIHGSGAATCTDCHGGDASAKEKETSHAGMTGRIARPDVPALCARCHSDVRRMNPFGLPTDQLDHYRTSKHGEAFAAGRMDAATCTDCHGTHGIRRSHDASSPVHPSRVPETCGRCHGDAELMKRHGLAATAPRAYAGGVHGQLLASGDRAAPTCATCHGNHGAVPPGFGEVAHVCGKCHVKQLEAFERSPHAFYAKDGSFKGCVVCHDHHAIVRTSGGVMERCGDCHDAGDAEMEKMRRLVAAAAAPKAEVERLEARVSEVERAGGHVDDERLALERARTSMLQIAPAMHALDAARIDALAAETRVALAEAESLLEAKVVAERRRRLALLPIWAFLAGMAALFWIKSRRLERKEATDAGSR